MNLLQMWLLFQNYAVIFLFFNQLIDDDDDKLMTMQHRTVTQLTCHYIRVALYCKFNNRFTG